MSSSGRRVIFVNRFFHPDISATSRLVSELAAGLAESGFRIHALTSRLEYEGKGRHLKPDEVWRGVKIERLWSSAYGRVARIGRAFDYLTFALAARRRLRRLLEPGDTVVSLTDPPMLPSLLLPVTKARDGRQVNWLQDIFPEVFLAINSRRTVHALCRPLVRFRNRSLTGAVNVTIGRDSQNWIEEVAPGTSRLIPNWANGRRIHPEAHERNLLRQKWNPGNRFTVGYFGNLGRVHDATTLLRAAEILRENPSILFLVAGGGAKIPMLQEEVKNRRLNNVRLLPYQPEEYLSLALGAADAHLVTLLPGMERFVFPSKFYGILAAGRPCLFVGSLHSEIANLIEAHRCGNAVANGDSICLARIIAELQGNSDRIEMMSRNSRSLFEESFDFPAALATWTKLFDELQSAS